MKTSEILILISITSSIALFIIALFQFVAIHKRDRLISILKFDNIYLADRETRIQIMYDNQKELNDIKEMKYIKDKRERLNIIEYYKKLLDERASISKQLFFANAENDQLNHKIVSLSEELWNYKTKTN